jgi:putative inorganic carbon (HCO3(-)) transporter
VRFHQKIIFILFAILLFLVPLILWPYTSELFEFNKMVLVYLLTTIITAVWITRMISEKRFLFRRTILDIPLLVFFGSQLISTIFSIDPQTSWLGYYSRFNGGLASTISYLLLYWAFVSNIDKKNALKLINITLISATLVSVYGVLEHLGIDKNVWQQDVQHRVFSTLGQPNWLAAWLVALIPISWALILSQKEKLKVKSFLIFALPYFLSVLFFITLIFTGSRSGLVGFAAADLIFWAIVFWKYKFKFLKHFFISNGIFIIAAFIFGAQWIANLISWYQLPIISKFVSHPQNVQTTTTQTGATALEVGGTESGVIRKIVWQGAIDIWKHYPIFGTGVETFAYSYYLYRPAAHNVTTEWDFIYNKAHNEYLNFLANTGTVGMLTYLAMIGFTIYLFVKSPFHKSKEEEDFSVLLPDALFAGYGSILVTNFFGFSVVPIELLFFLYPAFVVTLTSEEMPEKERGGSLTSNQKVSSWAVSFGVACLVFLICRYWYADILYTAGVNYNKAGRQDISPKYLSQAIKLEPSQSIYYAELAKSYTNLALAYNQAKQATTAAQLTEAAINNSIKAVNLAPANVNLKRMEFSVFVMLSTLDPNYLLDARDILLTAIQQAPTDAKLFYNLGLVYSRTGQNDLALQTLEKTVELKPNYTEARLAYAILLIDAKQNSEARTQLEYILTNLDPSNSLARQYLESIK